MKKKIILIGGIVALSLISADVFAQTLTPSHARTALSGLQAQTDSVISQLIQSELWVGGVASIQSGKDTQVSYYGTKSTEDSASPDQDSLFEIGSISKTFTGILAAQMILNHPDLSFDDPVSKFVPELLGSFAGTVTLRQLGVHTSGIPSIPCDDQENPTADYCFKSTDTYATYTEKRFLDYLKVFQPPATGPYAYSYSNAGVALLGYVVSRYENKSYDELLRTQITDPLQMKHTAVERPGKSFPNLLPGYNIAKQEQANWSFDVMAPAGAIISTGPDMAKYLSANLNPPASILGQAILLSQQTGICWDSHDNKIGSNSNAIWKNGGTAGFASILDFDPLQGIGIFSSGNLFSCLSNWAGFLPISNAPMPSVVGVVSLDSSILAAATGNFAVATDASQTVSISEINGHLFLSGGGNLLRLEPTTGTLASASFISYDGESFATSVTFQNNANGKFTSIVIHYYDGKTPDLNLTRSI